MTATTGAALAGRAETTAAALRSSGAWAPADETELDERFAAAATAALRVPALAERSARLRRLGRRVVPAPLRPGLRRATGALDRLVGAGLAGAAVLRGRR